MIPVFFGATFLIFYLVLGMPGDPLASMCGERGCDPATAAALRAQFHIGQPLYYQYFEYMKGIVTLDFGETFSRRPVTAVMREALPITIRLAIVAFVIETCIGVPLGLIAGLRRGKVFDTSMLLVSKTLPRRRPAIRPHGTPTHDSNTNATKECRD